MSTRKVLAGAVLMTVLAGLVRIGTADAAEQVERNVTTHTPSSASIPHTSTPKAAGERGGNSTQAKQQPTQTPQSQQPQSQQQCNDLVVSALQKAGFGPWGTRIMWAVVMRESRGESIGPGHWAYNGEDLGPLQFNREAWSHQPWWDETKLLQLEYAAQVAWKVTGGGVDYTPWGVRADGSIDASAYPMWNDTQVQEWIGKGFNEFFRTYPC